MREYMRTRPVRVLIHQHRFEITRVLPLAWRYACTLDGCEYFIDTFTRCVTPEEECWSRR
jgi:hypothetical protein